MYIYTYIYVCVSIYIERDQSLGQHQLGDGGEETGPEPQRRGDLRSGFGIFSSQHTVLGT